MKHENTLMLFNTFLLYEIEKAVKDRQVFTQHLVFCNCVFKCLSSQQVMLSPEAWRVSGYPERRTFPGVFMIAHLLLREALQGCWPPAHPASCACSVPVSPATGLCPRPELAMGASVLLTASSRSSHSYCALGCTKGKRGHSGKKGIYFQKLILKSTYSLCSVHY